MLPRRVTWWALVAPPVAATARRPPLLHNYPGKLHNYTGKLHNYPGKVEIAQPREHQPVLWITLGALAPTPPP